MVCTGGGVERVLLVLWMPDAAYTFPPTNEPTNEPTTNRSHQLTTIHPFTHPPTHPPPTLTEVYALPPERLYVTYFGGDAALGVAADEEARDFWLQFLPPDRVLPFGKKDNFWEVRGMRFSMHMAWRVCCGYVCVLCPSRTRCLTFSFLPVPSQHTTNLRWATRAPAAPAPRSTSTASAGGTRAASVGDQIISLKQSPKNKQEPNRSIDFHVNFRKTCGVDLFVSAGGTRAASVGRHSS